MTFDTAADPLFRGRATLDQHGVVAVLKMSNPKRRNAISIAMWKQIADAAAKIRGSRNVRALVIKGDGRSALNGGMANRRDKG